MARKMVTSDAIEVPVKKELKEMPCQGCGEPVMVMVPYVGDILCEKCISSKSYSLKTES